MSEDSALQGCNTSAATAGRTGTIRDRGFFFPPPFPMDVLGLDKVEGELRTACQSLWHYRTKDGATVELCNFLEPVQITLQELLEHVRATRVFLAEHPPL